MSLRFSPTGVAVYGTGTVAVDGTTPAALTGTVGPAAWENTGILVYQDGGTGSGPWTLKRLTLPATIANIDSSPASQIAGGGSRWGAFAAGLGVRTDIAVGPFASAALGDVSPDGELLLITSGIGVLSGLAVIDSSGNTIYQDTTIVLHSPQVCLRDSILSYFDATGWHLYDTANSATPTWFPRTDGVTALVPITHRGTLYVLEKANGVLSLRQADNSSGWILSSDPNIFTIDGVSIDSDTVICGTCNVPSETPASLVTFRCTVTKAKTIQVETGTIVAGAIDYGTLVSTTTTPFPVGPQEGQSLSTKPHMPVKEKLVNAHGLATMSWIKYWEKGDTNQDGTAAVVQNIPTPNLTTTAFDKVAASGQPTLQAAAGMNTLTFTSADGTMFFTLNPATNAVDFSQLQAGYWSLLTNGDPVTPELIFAGGDVISVWVPL